jgi:type IV pilus assembly protein PilM
MSRHLCGIDISDRTIEVVAMATRGHSAKVLMAARAELPSGLVERGVVQDAATLGAVLGDYLDRLFGKKRHVVAGVAIPEIQVYSRVFHLPSDLDDGEVEAALLEQAGKAMPIDLSTAMVAIDSLRPDGNGQNFYCSAVRSEAVAGYREALRIAGVQLKFLETESLALARAVVDTDEPVMLVDLGARTTLVTVFDEATRISANPMVGGDVLTLAIEHRLQLTYVKAEELKQKAGLNPAVQDGRVMLILQKPLAEIVEELRRTKSFFERQSGRALSQMVLVGGTSMMPGLVEYMAANFTDCRVRQGTPFSGLSIGDFPGSVKALDQHIFYATAVGLALRTCGAVDDSQIDFNSENSGRSGFASFINRLLQPFKLMLMPEKSTKNTKRANARSTKSDNKDGTAPKPKKAAAKKTTKTKNKKGEAAEILPMHEVAADDLKAKDLAPPTPAPPEMKSPGSGSLEDFLASDSERMPQVVPHELPAPGAENEPEGLSGSEGERSDYVVEDRKTEAQEEPATVLMGAVNGYSADGRAREEKVDGGEESWGASPSSSGKASDKLPSSVSFNGNGLSTPVEANPSAGVLLDLGDDKDYGNGIGDMLSRQNTESMAMPKMNLMPGEETPEDGVHRLKIEEILGHVRPSEVTVGDEEEADAPRRKEKRGKLTWLMVALVALVVLLFVGAAAGVFMFVSKHGLSLLGSGESPAALNEVSQPTAAPDLLRAPESVTVSVLLATTPVTAADGRLVVATRIVESDVTAEDAFEATGEIEAPAQVAAGPTKAEGSIMVVNGAGRAFTFVATTRFLSADGALFRMRRNADIAASGETAVEVYADVAGPGGNIGPTTFTIPGLSPAMQQQVTGRSDQPMQGGSTGVQDGEMVTAISDTDLTDAKEILVDRLATEAKGNFEVMVGEGEVIQDDLVIGTDLSLSAPAAGAMQDQFSMQLSQRYRAVLIPEAEILPLLTAALVEALPEPLSPADYDVGRPTYVVEAYDVETDRVELRVEAPVLSR